jgi:cell division control protein 45
MCVVKEGPDVALFNHPAALTKLGLWIGEALSEQERDATGKLSNGGRGTPLIVASLNEKRGVYVVVGTGGGGGPDTVYMSREAAKQRKAAKEERARKREQDKRNKERIREEKRAARRAARQGDQGSGDGDDDDDDREDDDDDDDDDDDGGDDDGDDDDDDDDDDADDNDNGDEAGISRGYGLNRFGSAFQEVVEETNARVRIDSFEHSVVEVKKEDLGAFLESLSMKAVVG